MRVDDYYEILQVHPKADADAIRAAYERMLDRYSAARLEGAADELVSLARQKRDDIERAYAVLADPQRRARYDDELALAPADELGEDEETLDYRPLPPAGRAERPRDIDRAQRRASPGGAAGGRLAQVNPALVVFGILAAVALIATAAFLISGQQPGTLLDAQPTATPTVDFNQFESEIAAAEAAAKQSPTDPDKWVDYGNVLYNSAEIVREFQPDSQLYQQRISRWLEATEAYSQALALDPQDSAVRADYGMSSCFYGAGTGSKDYVQRGLAAVQQAAQQLPSDPRVQISLGFCLISDDPPRVSEAMAAWVKVRETQPADSSFGRQAQQMIEQYSK
ncbi:DnaJ domain-containing protein [Chloroflexia bacterium SDU3-3]|nr:DnaJ domain-containing protein [Chloroflexia bacterium SDU3-3]